MKAIEINLSDILASPNTILSAEYHINRKMGRNPYMLKNNVYVPAKSWECKFATFMTEEDMRKVNELLVEKATIEKKIEDIIGDI